MPTTLYNMLAIDKSHTPCYFQNLLYLQIWFVVEFYYGKK